VAPIPSKEPHKCALAKKEKRANSHIQALHNCNTQLTLRTNSSNIAPDILLLLGLSIVTDISFCHLIIITENVAVFSAID
jgi:CRISPR/Cas system-associated protein Cas7 (RAMP superfamily)